jgi:hypothetical protein
MNFRKRKIRNMHFKMNYAQYGKSPHVYVTEKDIDVRRNNGSTECMSAFSLGCYILIPESDVRYSA